MGKLDGRVAIITGAGRGIGREHALLFAREGASVVVNDLGAGSDGSGTDTSPAAQVVAEITSLGGIAIANGDDVSDSEGARHLVQAAIKEFGQLDVLVNNAGILRDRMLVNMTEDEWDSVIRVHLRGHFLPLKWAAAHWREQAKAGHDVAASVINTSSTSGLASTPGQLNYGVAKTGIATMTEIAQKELGRLGVRVNAIAPVANTRLTAALLDAGNVTQHMAAEAAETGFNRLDPANISPVVAYLATRSCPIAGKVLFVYGGTVQLFRPYTVAETLELDRRWTIEELSSAAASWGEITWESGLKLE